MEETLGVHRSLRFDVRKAVALSLDDFAVAIDPQGQAGNVLLRHLRLNVVINAPVNVRADLCQRRETHDQPDHDDNSTHPYRLSFSIEPHHPASKERMDHVFVMSL